MINVYSTVCTKSGIKPNEPVSPKVVGLSKKFSEEILFFVFSSHQCTGMRVGMIIPLRLVLLCAGSSKDRDDPLYLA